MTTESKVQLLGGSVLELPTNTCAYERFDPKTLAPVNRETYIRLQEFGWSREDFAGRTVLDIGCNSGLLTLHALHLGAARVHACDVQPPLVEFVTQVVAAHRLPVTVERLAFDKLRPSERKTDIVLFMEVLHWAVSQGLELRDVIRRLAGLTEHLLYIEFPWSIQEPSIKAQTKLTEETYSADAVLDELTRYFRDVRVVRFMRYFGFGSESKRILIEARGKRPEATVLERLPGTYSLDVALSRGTNESYLLTAADGPLVAKLLARESLISQLPENLRNQMFDEINSAGPKTLVTPIKQGGEYLLAGDSGRHWMLFPFIGNLPSVRRKKFASVAFDDLINLFVKVRRDFRHLSPELLSLLRPHLCRLNVKWFSSPTSPWKSESSEIKELIPQIDAVLDDLSTISPETLDALCHGDLQSGNFVLDAEDCPRVVDLDNLGFGTIYSDGLTGLLWRAASPEVLARFCEALAKEESRPVARHDVYLAIVNGIAWYSSIPQGAPSNVVPEQISRLRDGLTEALRFAQSLPPGPAVA